MAGIALDIPEDFYVCKVLMLAAHLRLCDNALHKYNFYLLITQVCLCNLYFDFTASAEIKLPPVTAPQFTFVHHKSHENKNTKLLQ